MPRDQNGTYNLPNGTLVSSGDNVLPSQHNPPFQDVAQALTNSLSRDGSGGMRAPLDHGGFRGTNMAPGTSPTDAATVGQAALGVGFVVDFAGTSAPDGWLLCYGQAVSRTEYAALFAVIGTVYGAGDGATTFNIPDARGRTSAGKDDMGGASAGRLSGFSGTTLGAGVGSQNHALTTGQMPQHNHGVNDPGHTHTFDRIGPGGGGGPGGGNAFVNLATQTASKATGITIQNAGNGQAHPNVQPTIIFNKLIKARAA